MPLTSQKRMLQICHLWFWLVKIKLESGLIFGTGSRSRIYSCQEPDQKLDSCFHLCVESEPELESSFLEKIKMD